MPAFLGEEMQEEHPGNGTEKLEKLPEPEVEPLLWDQALHGASGDLDSIALQLLRVRYRS